MDLVIFEQNKPLVLQALENGNFDYVDAASEVFETEFFNYINAKSILKNLAETYPSPRKKEEVPLSIYLSSNLSLQLHGEHAFHAFPMVVRVGGMLNAFGPKAAKKVVHPDNGDVSLACDGFNNKNHYDRETPCDQDYLRKLSKDTKPDALMQWFGRDVVQMFRSQRAFDKEGIFIGDASYLFVPDNPNYVGSSKLLFDEHDHPVSKETKKKKTDDEKMRCQWRRCYKMVTLLHTNRNLDYFLFVGVRVISGKAHECPVLYELVKQFVQAAGKGVMKRLILDRGFLDGESISTCKREHKVDVLIPLRRNMDLYEDAAALFQQPDVRWVRFDKPEPQTTKPPRPRPKVVEKRERKRQEKLEKIKEDKPPPPPAKTLVKTQVAIISDFRSWSSCAVPLSVAANREHYADGHEEMWFLVDTKKLQDPKQPREEYHLRQAIEERYRQLKCFSDLTHFTSRALSLVVNQVVFVILAYSLLQLYLLRKNRRDLTNKPPPLIRKQLLPSNNYVIVYWHNYYGLFSHLEFMELMTVSLSDEARKKIGAKSRRLRHELTELLRNPRPP